jgi:hypothetical protein
MFFTARVELDKFEGQIEKYYGFVGQNFVLLSPYKEGYKTKQGVVQGQTGKDLK